VSATSPAAATTAEPSLSAVCHRFWWPVYGAWRDGGEPAERAAAKTLRVLDRLGRGSPFLRHEDHDGRLRILMREEQLAVASDDVGGSTGPMAGAHGVVDIPGAEARDTYSTTPVPEQKFWDRWAIVVMEQALEALLLRASAAGTEGQARRLLPYLERDVPDWRTTDIGEAVDTMEVNNLRDAYRTEVRRVVSSTVTTPMALEAELVELFG